MEEMRGFVKANVDTTDGAEGNVAQVYDGFASIFRRISDLVAGSGRVFEDGLSDADVLHAGAEMASSLARSTQ